jgi:hypothetical protein
MSQNNPLVLVGFYKTIPSSIKCKVLDVSSVFLMDKSCIEKCTRSFPRCYVNRGKVTSWRILVTPFAAPSIFKQVPIEGLISKTSDIHAVWRKMQMQVGILKELEVFPHFINNWEGELTGKHPNTYVLRIRYVCVAHAIRMCYVCLTCVLRMRYVWIVPKFVRPLNLNLVANG